MLKDKTILIISPEKWDSISLSKHHYALELSKNNQVFFLNPPSKSWNNKQEAELHIVDYVNYFRASNRLPFFLRKYLQILQAKSILRFLSLSKIDVVWSFDPYRFQYLPAFLAEANIYHEVDEHRLQHSRETASSADLVLYVSKLYEKHFEGISTPKYHVNHGLSKHFLDIRDKKNLGDDKIKVAIVGNLGHKDFDAVVFFEICEKHPNVDFYFIGPTKTDIPSQKDQLDKLKSLANVFFLGRIYSQEISSYLMSFDILMCCYRHFFNPHKILEYLSSGKVIISSFLPDYEGNALLVMEKTKEGFIRKFDEVLSDIGKYNSPKLQQERRAFALEYSYQKHIERISTLLDKHCTRFL